MDPRVVIVGAGAAGLSTAFHLTRRGCRNVTLIEKGYPAEASSGRSVGVFTRQYFDPIDIKLRVRAYELLRELERDTHLVLTQTGFMRLAHDEPTMESFAKATELQVSMGVDDARAMDSEELGRLIPDMNREGIVGAMLVPSDGYLDGQQLCMTYAELAQGAGADLRVKTELIGHESLSGGGHRLQTSRGEIECDVVVNAAGAWAPRVGEVLDAEVEIRPERHQACVFELEQRLPYRLPMIMDYVPGSGVEGLYLRPEGESQVIAGLHTNDRIDEALVDDVDHFHEGADATFVDALIPKLLERMPGLAGMGLRNGWAGIYPNSHDDEFIVGEHGEGIFDVCGLSGLGIYTSPVLGEIASQWILDGRPGDNDYERYSPLRRGA